MKAAKAIFDDTEQATNWHAKYRERLQLDPAGVEAARRSMQRYARAMNRGDERRRVVRNAAKYCRDHRDRMRYSEFTSRGLPIGSGPVEAAAKNIVQARAGRGSEPRFLLALPAEAEGRSLRGGGLTGSRLGRNGRKS